MRYISMVAILTLFLIATPSISLVHSSLQQELVVSNQGTILVPDNFANTIILEYGAESSELQPPWDYVATGGQITFPTSPVRTGTKSAKFYVEDPDYLDSQHCKVLEYTDYGVSEAYYSAWFYIPEGTVVNDWVLPFQWKDSNPSGPPGNEYRVIAGIFFLNTPNNPAGYFSIHLNPFAQSDGRLRNASASDVPTGRWFHVQVWIRTSRGFQVMDGAVKVWIDNELVVDWEKVGTRGEGPKSHYMWGVGNYVSLNEPDATSLYVDDIVMATERVPENYSVMD